MNVFDQRNQRRSEIRTDEREVRKVFIAIVVVAGVLAIILLSAPLWAGIGGHYTFDGINGQRYYVNRDQIIGFTASDDMLHYYRNGVEVSIPVIDGDDVLDPDEFVQLENDEGFTDWLSTDYFNYVSVEGGLPFVWPMVLTVPDTQANRDALMGVPNTRVVDRFGGGIVLVNVDRSSVYVDPALPGRLIGSGPLLVDSPENRDKLGIPAW